MTHSPPKRKSSDDNDITEEDAILSDEQHTVSILALCMSVFTISYLLIEVFPYSGYMAMHLIPHLTEETTGLYAGIISSSFMVGRVVSSYTWGKVADVYGRVFVLQASLLLSCVFTILFGLSTTYKGALFWRFLLGAGNGILPVAKTAVSELANGNAKLETKGMGLVMGMWAWAMLVSPALSGVMSDPIRQYPDISWIQQNDFFRQYPFFLPNGLGAIFVFVSMILVHVSVIETLPPDKLRPFQKIPKDFVTYVSNRFFQSRSLSLLSSQENVIETTPILEQERQQDGNEYGSQIDGSNRQPERTDIDLLESRDADKNDMTVPQNATIASLWAQRSTRNHMIVYWLGSFGMVALDEAFPLFCISKEAGLGLSELAIGKVMSTSGLMFAILNYAVYDFFVKRMGLYGAVRVGSSIMGPMIVAIPLSIFINGSHTGELTTATFAFLSLSMGIYRIFGLTYFSSVAVALNRTVIPEHRGTMNGLSTVGGSVCKAISPTAAGALVSFAFSSGVVRPHVGAFLVFAIIACVPVCVFIVSFSILEGATEK